MTYIKYEYHYNQQIDTTNVWISMKLNQDLTEKNLPSFDSKAPQATRNSPKITNKSWNGVKCLIFLGKSTMFSLFHSRTLTQRTHQNNTVSEEQRKQIQNPEMKKGGKRKNQEKGKEIGKNPKRQWGFMKRAIEEA